MFASGFGGGGRAHYNLAAPHGAKRLQEVLGLSGGIDSSTVAALCVRAFGTNNVLGLLMPEG